MKIGNLIAPFLIATVMGWSPASPAAEADAPEDLSQTVRATARIETPTPTEPTPWVALKMTLKKITYPPPAPEERAVAPTNPNVPVLPTNRPTPPTGFPQ